MIGFSGIRNLMHAVGRESPGTWPLDLGDPPLIVKSEVTPTMAGATVPERLAAKAAISRALVVTDPHRVRGRKVAVLDDVFTTGNTLDAVARALRSSGGATEVIGISVARAMFPDDYPSP